MNLIRPVLIIIVLSSLGVSAQTLELANKWSLHFSLAQWKEIELSVLKEGQIKFLKHKTVPDLELTLQIETHNLNAGKAGLIKRECENADKIYRSNKSGGAKIVAINNKEACFVQMGKRSQILFPVRFNKISYDLLSLSWKDNSEQKYKEILKLAGENL